MKVAILVVSDRVSSGGRTDSSGEAASRWVRDMGWNVAAQDVVPDETAVICQHLLKYCDAEGVDLVLTTGGTGLSPRDVTPEATLAVAERIVPGLAEMTRGTAGAGNARAYLSRSVCAARGRSLIVNLPGSPKAVRESLRVLGPVLGHAIEVLRGTDDHDRDA